MPALKPALALALVAVAASMAAPAAAAPATLSVRIEGASQTLFEGPVSTGPRLIRASSDTSSRTCDATGGGSGAPRATPTVAAADAMALIGETFDGRWYPDFGDYLIRRWGPQDQGGGKYWALAVDGVAATAGGCQIGLTSGAGVLWAFGASASTPYLRLSAASDPSPAPGPAAPTATVGTGDALALRVQRSTGSGAPTPAASVTIAPVSTATDGKGYQTTLTSDPRAVQTGSDGSATVVFDTPGWHRIKATSGGFVRSNRLDVCVRSAEQDCGPPPADTLVRAYDPSADPGAGAGADADAPAIGGTERPGAGIGRLQISRPRVSAKGAARGLIAVSWRILEQGPGLRSWTIRSRAAGPRGARFRRRASGQAATSALLRLPPGHLHDLRYSATDARGQTSSVDFARVLVPIDDRAPSLAYRGYWGRLAAAGAWRRTVSRGAPGSEVKLRLGPGRPVFSLRRGRRPALVEVRGANGVRRVRITGGRGSRRLVRGAKRARAGTVALRILRGSVDLDGVAVGP